MLHGRPAFEPGFFSSMIGRMDILPEIGHAAVTVDNRVHAFRPTLARIASLGSPAEIVELAGVLLSGPPVAEHAWRQRQIDRQHWRAQLGAALTVLYCCADEADADLLGTLTPPNRYRRGLISPEVLVLLAQQMVRHGVVGVLPVDQLPPAPSASDYVPEFRAADMAALAQAHLGASTAEAWGMTMTGLARAMAAKYPAPTGKDGAPAKPMTVEDNDRALAWLERVNEARANG